MEKQPNPESIKSPDFLNEKLHISLEISDTAFEYLPEVTEEDMQTKIERYRALLGKWEVVSEENVVLKIEAVLEMPDEPRYYLESKESVTNINIIGLQKVAQHISEHDTEAKGLELVGDIHTHPVTQEELSSHQRPWILSPEDIAAMIETYKNGSLSKNKPFIFGIAAPMPDGKTGYKFYRLTKNEEVYSVMEVK